MKSHILFPILLALACAAPAATPRKPRIVAIGPVRQVAYSRAGDPAGAAIDEKLLRIRPLVVDGRVTEWTTGEPHDVTDRSFAVRRALKINDALPGDKATASHWVWQRGPWLLIDRTTGHVTALKLPDYDPAASQVSWFRDYAAYCGVTSSGKSLFAVVAQIAQHKPLIAKKLFAWDPANHPDPVCAPPEWQREPMRVTFHPAGKDPVSYDVIGNSAVLIEDTDDDTDPPK